MITEHIYIGDEFADMSTEPTNVSNQVTVSNYVNGTVHELTFYGEGYLQVRETRKGRQNRELMLELLYLDAKPNHVKNTARGFLWAALGTGLIALLTSMILPMTALAQYVVPATISVATVATILLLLFVYRTEEVFRFRTASGKAVVLKLSSSFGCIRKMRSIVKEISRAIEASSSRIRVRDVNYLRAEMKAHYKLAETGVITREACSDGTSLILSKFG